MRKSILATAVAAVIDPVSSKTGPYNTTAGHFGDNVGASPHGNYGFINEPVDESPTPPDPERT